MTAWAATAAAAAVLLLIRPVGGRPFRVPPPAVLITAAAAVLLVDGRVSPVLVVVTVLVAGVLVREVRRRRDLQVERLRAESVLGFCEMLAADLRAGSAATAALVCAVEEWPDLRVVADAAVLGADVPGALRVLADRPGAEQLRLVAAAWVVAHRSGAGLAAAVDLAACTIREDRASARVVATELAAATATARLLAALPVGVLLIGHGAGGDPVGFLLGTTPGSLCLVAGLSLGAAGLFWMERIADGVRRA